MAGNLSFDELKKAIAAGEIDTVLACGVDMQGRLVRQALPRLLLRRVGA